MGGLDELELLEPANRGEWGPIYAGREALQSIRFDRPVVLTKVELLVARDVRVGGTSFRQRRGRRR